MTPKSLIKENRMYQGTPAISKNNRDSGFKPAFKDVDTGQVYLSCFVDGKLAPIHLLDGLPEDLILERNRYGQATRVKARIVSGFEKCGKFFMRSETKRMSM